MGNGRTQGRKLVGCDRTYNNRLIYVEDCVIISQGGMCQRVYSPDLMCYARTQVLVLSTFRNYRLENDCSEKFLNNCIN